jgi:predicted phosphate transport protein (TIGR00153 family)
MLKRLLPRETSFFDFFERHSELSIEASKELNAIGLHPAELTTRVGRIKEIEHTADDVTHKCIDALHRTFITPIDRSDIHRLIRRLDDIIDCIDSATSRMILYEINDIRPEFRQFTEELLKATTGIDGAIRSLRDLRHGEKAIAEFCAVIYEAEKNCDQILRKALARLFKEEKEAILVLKWKGIFERLEKAADRCEEVANIVEGIVIEAS